jgi:hypothetical protein
VGIENSDQQSGFSFAIPMGLIPARTFALEAD